MPPFDDSQEFPGLDARRFVTTPWTEVLLAGEQNAPGATEAQRAVETDPFVLEGLVGSYLLKQWIPE